jgi:hypothetical protein
VLGAVWAWTACDMTGTASRKVAPIVAMVSLCMTWSPIIALRPSRCPAASRSCRTAASRGRRSGRAPRTVRPDRSPPSSSPCLPEAWGQSRDRWSRPHSSQEIDTINGMSGLPWKADEDLRRNARSGFCRQKGQGPCGGLRFRSTAVHDSIAHHPGRTTAPWNRGKLIGPKPPLKAKEIWSIRVRLQVAQRIRDLALFDLALDSKLRTCDLVASGW